MLLPDTTRSEIEYRYETDKLFLKTYNYDNLFQNGESTDKKESTDLPAMPALEGKEVKEGKGLKILTPNKSLTRLPILLASTNKSRK